jgi:hypothetical protein
MTRGHVIFALTLMVSACAHAEQSQVCAVNGVPALLRGRNCECGTTLTTRFTRNLKAFPRFAGFTLVSACDVKAVPEDPSAVTGSFHFRGARSLKGLIHAEQTPAGDLFFLHAAAPLVKSGSSTLRELRFSDEPGALRAFGAPRTGGCWQAPGRLKSAKLQCAEMLGQTSKERIS